MNDKNSNELLSLDYNPDIRPWAQITADYAAALKKQPAFSVNYVPAPKNPFVEIVAKDFKTTGHGGR
ncbi:MAG: hypothetical protein LBJ18_01785 [Rickettsiales bacterium]|jgi:hypothetical protein|nr:hypothetical protein [Rickettsiales bacterium]